MPKFEEVVASLRNDGHDVDDDSVEVAVAVQACYCERCHATFHIGAHCLRFLISDSVTGEHHVCLDFAACRKSVTDDEWVEEQAEAKRIANVEAEVTL